MNNIKSYGIASGIGAKISGSELGVWKLFYNIEKYIPDILLSDVFFSNSIKTKLDVINDLYTFFLKVNEQITKDYSDVNKYLFLTGDHSNAAGIWASILNQTKGDLGLLWIDSHLDSHTPETSDSKAVHGMPISSLLGIGDKQLNSLTKYHLKPNNLCFIGTNSYEPAELDLLEKLKVKIFYTKDINSKNINQIFKEAISHITKNTAHFGISLDIDSMNNSEMPATGCYTKKGLKLSWVIDILHDIAKNPKFIGIELTEFNPELDKNEKTFLGIIKIIKSVFNCSINK